MWRRCSQRRRRVLKKIGEEATETVMAAKDGDKLRITAEIADLWFHCLVLLERHGLGPDDVRAELERREVRRESPKRPRAKSDGASQTDQACGDCRITENERCRTAFSARSCGRDPVAEGLRG
jgi:phosphoribosyl-ATP pyrophosphohydrolase